MNAPLPARDAVVEVLRREGPALLAFARRQDPAAAEEALSRAWLRALEKADSLNNPSSARAWVYRILRNELAREQRRRGREAARRTPLEDLPLTAPPPPEPPPSCGCAGQLLDELSPGHARLLAQVHLEERPLAEVAADEGITPGNARVRLHRARAALRRSLAKCCGVTDLQGALDCGCGCG